ncbi:MAG: ATP-binding cassette domain-containing protein [Pseudomonadota bacterium]
MARPPLLQLNEIRLGYGGNPIFAGLDLVIQPGDRVALVGRNGSGKSTLMKVMAGQVEADTGTITAAPGTSVGYMEQDPDLSGFATLGDFARATLDPSEAYRIDVAAEGLKLDLDISTEAASGGERRRAALARLLAEAPDLMLLDEPTNHLDIQAIAWLEEHLRSTRAAFVLISHDRAFLTALTRATLWIDRGVVRRQERGFADFEAWRDKTWEEEDLARHKLDRKIKAEARWAVEGISARRKRNQGRVRALGELRQQRADMIRRQGTADMALEAGKSSGKRVIEARGIAKSFGDKTILRPFDLRVLRGDRIAFVGPNGAGKTTLLKMLTGELAPDSGSVTLGTNLETAVFDQRREGLDTDASLWENLTGDKEMRVSGRADQVMVRGTPRHVVGYLKEFLFTDDQARSPVRALSGGERARLLLARIMARESNLLVLDEPTNDLDIETLDLLQEILSDYPGTVLLVSHDRDFLDRVATTTIAMEGDGRATAYAGGWSDYLSQRAEAVPALAGPAQAKQTAKATAKPQPKAEAPGASAPSKTGLSFTERHRLDALPGEIDRLSAEITKLEEFLAAPDLYTREPVKFQKATEALVERQTALQDAEDEWLELEERAGG